jgi:WD40 repeat protein
MSFRPNVHDELIIDGVAYRIAEHPAAPGFPYGQEGRAGIVYCLQNPATASKAALKVFKPRFRTPALVSQAEKLAAFADLPGLTVCRRTVLTRAQNADLLRQHPDLIYAVLMPWIEGPTWTEVMLEKRPLTPQQALDLARALAEVLESMEVHGLAHCDLSGPNVLLPMLAGQTADRRPQTAYRPPSAVELVDVEGLYAPGLPRPEALPSGSSGYAHRTAREGLWGPTADRFAGAVLLAEMLGWGDESVREACYGETYFDPAEMPAQGSTGEAVLRPNPPRYRTLTAALARHYGQPVADLFERAWTSETLADCPTFGEWLVALPEHPVAQAFSLSTPAAETTEAQASTSPEEVTLGVVRGLMQAARRMEDKGNLENALELYRQALELAGADPALRSLAREIELILQDVEKRAAAKPFIPQPPLSPLPVFPLPLGEGEGVRETPPRKRSRRWVIVGLVLFGLVLLSGLWLVGTFRPTATITPAPTVTPLVLPVLAGTPYPQPNQPIGLTNAGQVEELARWGKGTANQVIFSPDGRLLAVASSLGIYLYDAETLAEVRFIETDAWVPSVAFSPDGRLLASGSGDNTVILWDVETGQAVRTLRGHTDWVSSVAFSPDGRLLASGSGDNTVILWDVETGQAVRTLRGHTKQVRSVAFSPDGRLLASGSGDGTVKLWDVGVATKDFSSPPEVRTLSGHNGWVLSVAFSPDGRLLASCSNDGTVKLWDVATGQEVRTLSGHNAGVLSVAFSPDGRLLASGSGDGTVKLWDVATGQAVRTLRGHTDWVWSVAFSPDGRLLASGSDDGTVKLWDVATGQEMRTLSGHNGGVQSVAFSPDGRLLASCSNDGTVKLWDVATGQEVRTLSGHNAGVLSVAFSPDGRLLASGSDDGTVKLWDVATGQEMRTLSGHNGGVQSVAFSPDGRLLASGSWDKTVKLWDVATGQEVRTLSGHTNAVQSVAFSPDGRLLASGSWDKTVKLWDVATGQEVRTLSGHTNAVQSVAFSPDGRLLASGSDDGTVKLWDVATGQEMRTLSGHNGWVLSVAFSPDGRLLASGSGDGTVKLWDVGVATKDFSSPPEVRTLSGHNGWVLSVAFSPDGRLLASGSRDGTVRIWGVGP